MREDGRSKRDRVARIDFHCTVCGSQLGDDTGTWGIVWDSRKHGICLECLTQLRRTVDPKRVEAFESRFEDAKFLSNNEVSDDFEIEEENGEDSTFLD